MFKLMCKEMGITQKDALEELALGRNAAQRWAGGMPNSETLFKISNHFGVPTDVMYSVMNCLDVDVGKALLKDHFVNAKNDKTKKAAPLAGSDLNPKYYDLTPENRALIDGMIEQMLKAQSAD